MNKLVIMLCALVALFFVFSGMLLFQANEEIADLSFHEVKMENLGDGVYRGLASTTLVKAEVEVEVKNNKIVRMDILRHDHGIGQKAKEIEHFIQEEIIRTNSYDIDAVSGATISYAVIKSAVSDALAKGLK